MAMTDDELLDRVHLLAPGIVMLRQVPHVTVQTVEVMFNHAGSLMKEAKRRVMVADLTEASMPSAEVRAQLRARIGDLSLDDFRVVVGDNTIIKIAAQFVVASLGFPVSHAFSTVEDALGDLPLD